MTSNGLSEGQRKALECLPNPSPKVAEQLGISTDAAYHRLNRLRDKGVIDQDDSGEWFQVDTEPEATVPDLSDVDVDPDAEPNPDELTDRERYIASELENVGFKIGRAGSPTPFWLRGGEIHGQLRHGQDRSPQADTSARKKEWLSTLLDSENFGEKMDLAWMGHHHISGLLPWNGPPVVISGSPKPSGEYPRKLGEVVGPNRPNIATAHGVSDDGLTGFFPIDTRKYDAN
jgi:biotin operon repressor